MESSGFIGSIQDREGVHMAAPVERKLQGVTLRPREYFAPKVPVGPQTAAQMEEMLRAVRSVIAGHRQVLEALKDR